MSLRFRIEPRDAPEHVAARRMGLVEARFTEMLPALFARGFPRPDTTTGLYDLDAIDEWRRRRHPELFLVATEGARDARAVVRDRLERMRDG